MANKKPVKRDIIETILLSGFVFFAGGYVVAKCIIFLVTGRN